jgi:hypothetical protein
METSDENPVLYAMKFKEMLGNESIAKGWNDIKNEWRNTHIIREIPYGSTVNDDIRNWVNEHGISNFCIGKCICGHKIQDHCVIENKHTKKRLCIGNHCIQHLSELEYAESKHTFDYIKKVRNGFVDDIYQIFRKPSLSLKQHVPVSLRHVVDMLAKDKRRKLYTKNKDIVCFWVDLPLLENVYEINTQLLKSGFIFKGFKTFTVVLSFTLIVM